jgi:hypothetical protein
MLRFRSKLDALQGLKPLTDPPPRYAEWIDFCFGRLQRLEAADIADERLSHDDFPVTDAELVPLFEVTMRRSGEDLVPFDDEVVGGGLALILDGSLTDFGYRIRNATVAVERKVNAVAAMKLLYEQVFEPRCLPLLGHLSETGHSRLAYICYMLWDVTQIAHWPPEDEGQPLPQAILDLLEGTLGSKNDAVVESGLHGIGHLASSPRRQEIIGRLLERRPELRPELRTYAQACAAGCMQ